MGEPEARYYELLQHPRAMPYGHGAQMLQLIPDQDKLSMHLSPKAISCHNIDV